MSEWKIKRGESEFVASDASTLQEWARAGRLAESDLVFHPLLGRWMYAKELGELSGYLQKPRRTSPVAWGCLGCLILFVVLGVIAEFTKKSNSERIEADAAIAARDTDELIKKAMQIGLVTKVRSEPPAEIQVNREIWNTLTLAGKRTMITQLWIYCKRHSSEFALRTRTDPMMPGVTLVDSVTGTQLGGMHFAGGVPNIYIGGSD